VGPHLPLGLGLMRIPERLAEIGASAVQIFSDNPTAWRRRAELPSELPAFRRRLVELDIAPLAIHAAYLVNLAGPDEGLFRRSVEVLLRELTTAPEYGARFVNVHAGSHRGSGREAGVDRLADGLARTLAEAPNGADAPLLVIENSSGGGDNLGATLEELTQILTAAGARGLDGRLAFCLDTAHLWGAGYDLSEPSTVDAVVARFDSLIGLERLAMIHLNDSHSALGSRHDRHAHIGDGHIGPAGLARFLHHPDLAGAAFYLETPDMEKGYDGVNMARLADLVAGRALTPAPDSAIPLTPSPDAAAPDARPQTPHTRRTRL
jgi:deoxyribonuclease-4